MISNHLILVVSIISFAILATSALVLRRVRLRNNTNKAVVEPLVPVLGDVGKPLAPDLREPTLSFKKAANKPSKLDDQAFLHAIDEQNIEEFCQLLSQAYKAQNGDHVQFLIPANKELNNYQLIDHSNNLLLNGKATEVMKKMFAEEENTLHQLTPGDVIKLQSLQFPLDDYHHYAMVRDAQVSQGEAIVMIISASSQEPITPKHFKDALSPAARLMRWYALAYKNHCYNKLKVKATQLGQQAIEVLNARKRELDNAKKTDALTNVYNRSFFTKVLNSEALRAERYKHSLSVIIGDVDKLGEINNHHGYTAGDDLLKHIAQLLKGTLRDSDQLARWSDNQFIITLPETNHFGALQIAERLRLKCERSQFVCNSQAIKTTLTLGAITLNKNFSDIEFQIEKVIKSAKSKGCNHIVSSEQID